MQNDKPYTVVVLHPQIGGVKEYQVTSEPKGEAKLDVKIDAPTGRLYANEMVDRPYTGFRRIRRVRSCRPYSARRHREPSRWLAHPPHSA
jgi:hypothetical protein